MAANSFYTMRPVIPQTRTDTASRVTIKNIPMGVTEAQLKANLAQHGDIRIHMFVPGTEYGSGWAWVSCEQQQDVQRLLACAAERREQAAAALREQQKQHKAAAGPAAAAAAADEAAAAETADDAKSSDCSDEARSDA
ncbi:hypothetical protein, conserved [Eimeria tenella]|uniref:RRM domain-containing protein n=1 Tax=Eimeria tenella TaxID=5802 RepID=U6KRV6_EIMTE|nr:hypothetical protein, conserved [Eimeria tenella]CDJ39089.1 hypothetical protein, conserved [Eimeria tenella]|eukprot:XP_013229844.1 hypothetical protein, conserved [Eimeria tenella]